MEIPDEDDRVKHDFTLDKRFHLVPEAKVLIVIPPGNDKLILRRADLEAAVNNLPRKKKP